MDVTGDGKDDLLARYANGAFEVYASNWLTLTLSGTFTTQFSDTNGWNTGHRFFVMDIDGTVSSTGRRAKELVTRDNWGTFQVWRSNGSVLVFANAFSTELDNARGWDEGHRFIVMDIDGDHRDDLAVRRSDGDLSIWSSNGTSLSAGDSPRIETPFRTGAGWKFGHRYFPMDLNGDGKDDLLARDSTGEFAVWRSNGSTLSQFSTFATPFTDASGWNEGNRFY